MANHKVDIFSLLDRLSLGEKDIWNTFSEDEQKTIAPLILMRWLSGVSGSSSPRQIIYLNTLVNHLIFALAKHPNLLMNVMSCCTSKHSARCQWIGQKKSDSQKKLSVKVLQQYYNYSSREASSYLKVVNKDMIIDLAEQLGWEKDEMTKLKKEL